MLANSLSYQWEWFEAGITGLIIPVRAHIPTDWSAAPIHCFLMQRLIRFETVSFRLLPSVPPRPQRLTPIRESYSVQHLSSNLCAHLPAALHKERPHTRVRLCDQFAVCHLIASFRFRITSRFFKTNDHCSQICSSKLETLFQFQISLLMSHLIACCDA